MAVRFEFRKGSVVCSYVALESGSVRVWYVRAAAFVGTRRPGRRGWMVW